MKVLRTKDILKRCLADISYLLYKTGVKKNPLHVCSVEETIDELITTDKSMVRFGDSDITMIRGKNVTLQEAQPEITDSLKRILAYQYEGLIIAVPMIFEDLSPYQKTTRNFWKEHLFFSRKVYEEYCNTDKMYYNAYISRVYYPYQDKSKCAGWIENIKKIWENKDVIIVEGSRTHNGVGNDLLDTARSVQRIIGPASGAYAKIEDIFSACKKCSKKKLFLISMGSTAKILAERLFLEGYRVLDIGNMDMEYEWYLMKAREKEKIKKHDCMSLEDNKKAGYQEYLDQIITVIE